MEIRVISVKNPRCKVRSHLKTYCILFVLRADVNLIGKFIFSFVKLAVGIFCLFEA